MHFHCPQHQCADCQQNTTDAGGMLYRWYVILEQFLPVQDLSLGCETFLESDEMTVPKYDQEILLATPLRVTRGVYSLLSYP